MKGKLELAMEKQAKALMVNCKPVMDRVEGNRKLVLSPGVRFYRETCCQVESHCVNAGEQGYRGGMLEVLARIKVAMAMNDVCSELSMRKLSARWIC